MHEGSLVRPHVVPERDGALDQDLLGVRREHANPRSRARTPAHLTFTARVTSGDGRFQPPGRTAYTLEAIGVPRPERVTNRGRPVAFTWENGRLAVTVPAHPEPLVEME